MSAAGTQTFCGECGHPMHWHECGAGVNTAGPCRCRNDEAIPYRDTWANGRESRYQRTARTDPLTGTLTLPGPIPGSTLHVRERDKPDPVRGCSVISWVILSWVITALLVIAVVSCVATPSSAVHVGAARFSAAPFEGRGATTEHDRLSGAPQRLGTDARSVGHALGTANRLPSTVTSPPEDTEAGGAPPLSAFYASLAADAYRPRIDTLTGTAADVTRQGIWSYADRSYGPGYLAIPEGPGWLIRACGPAACIERVSTDAGPALFLQRAGRLGDLSAVDFEAICGLSAAQRVIFGLCPGSLTLLHRPAGLPETDAP